MRRRGTVDALADVIGATTVGIGAGLSLDPIRCAKLLGLPGEPRRSRAIGLVDVVLGTMILTSGRVWPRRRWPVLVGREALHLVIVNEYRRQGNAQGALTMCGLFLVDGIATVLMYRQEASS
ncbi:hypothetical protein [Nesterenkonia ebinurensis]|uniref:hypothetical protein n=1 Tax=Nesterenkonia ebinurensis TaxID=2608252 RepID=UPI00123E428E|nr:hypothetical protein [Nesterenkonia ebinurensis]